MKNKDLQGMIREMAARLEMHQTDDIGPCPGVLSEVEAYMAVDPTLASLHKQYMDARRTRLRALEQQGEGSAMADIARDLEDSAQSAMETRMIELREDEIKRLMVERMMAHAYGVDMDERRASSAAFYARRESEFAVAQKQDRLTAARHVRESEDSFLALMTMWWMMRQMAWRTQVKLSLASSFSRALHRAFERDPDYVTGAA